MKEKVLLRNAHLPESHRIATYLSRGGYKNFKKALKEMDPAQITELVKEAGLRGRGGAGFPAGIKWSFVPKNSGKPIYLLCNADESEPGTFKDIVIMEKDPHLLLEGIAIAAYAIGVHTAFIYIRGEFHDGARILEEAIEEARRENWLGENILETGYSLDIWVHRGAGAYICGEEMALISSLEGQRGYPRVKPPFPAVSGFFGCPTIVNNVETLANVPFIIERGVDWYRTMGSERNYGPKLYCISGHVNNPGVFELALGEKTLKQLIEEEGKGVPNNKKVKAVFPGGSSAPVLTADEIDVRADFDAVQQAGSMLGSAGLIVMDETTDMVNVTLNLARFYAHESCGQCTPCRDGSLWLVKVLRRFIEGGGNKDDIDLMLEICDNIDGRTICPLGAALAWPIRSVLQKFRSEFEAKLRTDA
ncbi:NADH-quinone oxidoreductase subunit NuoF [candidate division KSB1 bacterium]